MAEGDARRLVDQWRRRERPALAELGLEPAGEDRYELPLGVDFRGRIAVRKIYGGNRGQTVEQSNPSAGLIHVATERLIRELRGEDPGQLGMTVSMPQPPEGYRARIRLVVTVDEEIPEAIRETARLIREVFMPELAGWTDLTRVRRSIEADASPGFRTRRLEHLAVLAHLDGDRDAAAAALREYRSIAGSTFVPEVDDPELRFAKALAELLAA